MALVRALRSLMPSGSTASSATAAAAVTSSSNNMLLPFSARQISTGSTPPHATAAPPVSSASSSGQLGEIRPNNAEFVVSRLDTVVHVVRLLLGLSKGC